MMGIGTSKGAFYDDGFHYSQSQWDPKYDDNVLTPNKLQTDRALEAAELNPSTGLGIDVADKMPFPNNRNSDSDFASRFGNLAPSGILNDLKKPNVDPTPLMRKISDTPDYDYEGWKQANPDVRMSPGQHYPDTFKLPNHITFSNESKYHSDETPGGQWSKQEDGSWSFKPSEFNLKQHSEEELKSYFSQHEKGNKLDLSK